MTNHTPFKYECKRKKTSDIFQNHNHLWDFLTCTSKGIYLSFSSTFKFLFKERETYTLNYCSMFCGRYEFILTFIFLCLPLNSFILSFIYIIHMHQNDAFIHLNWWSTASHPNEQTIKWFRMAKEKAIFTNKPANKQKQCYTLFWLTICYMLRKYGDPMNWIRCKYAPN